MARCRRLQQGITVFPRCPGTSWPARGGREGLLPAVLGRRLLLGRLLGRSFKVTCLVTLVPIGETSRTDVIGGGRDAWGHEDFLPGATPVAEGRLAWPGHEGMPVFLLAGLTHHGIDHGAWLAQAGAALELRTTPFAIDERFSVGNGSPSIPLRTTTRHCDTLSFQPAPGLPGQVAGLLIRSSLKCTPNRFGVHREES
jgi:hypothetical protein